MTGSSVSAGMPRKSAGSAGSRVKHSPWSPLPPRERHTSCHIAHRATLGSAHAPRGDGRACTSPVSSGDGGICPGDRAGRGSSLRSRLCSRSCAPPAASATDDGNVMGCFMCSDAASLPPKVSEAASRSEVRARSRASRTSWYPRPRRNRTTSSTVAPPPASPSIAPQAHGRRKRARPGRSPGASAHFGGRIDDHWTGPAASRIFRRRS